MNLLLVLLLSGVATIGSIKLLLSQFGKMKMSISNKMEGRMYQSLPGGDGSQKKIMPPMVGPIQNPATQGTTQVASTSTTTTQSNTIGNMGILGRFNNIFRRNGEGRNLIQNPENTTQKAPTISNEINAKKVVLSQNGSKINTAIDKSRVGVRQRGNSTFNMQDGIRKITGPKRIECHFQGGINKIVKPKESRYNVQGGIRKIRAPKSINSINSMQVKDLSSVEGTSTGEVVSNGKVKRGNKEKTSKNNNNVQTENTAQAGSTAQIENATQAENVAQAEKQDNKENRAKKKVKMMTKTVVKTVLKAPVGMLNKISLLKAETERMIEERLDARLRNRFEDKSGDKPEDKNVIGVAVNDIYSPNVFNVENRRYFPITSVSSPSIVDISKDHRNDDLTRKQKTQMVSLVRELNTEELNSPTGEYIPDRNVSSGTDSAHDIVKNFPNLDVKAQAKLFKATEEIYKRTTLNERIEAAREASKNFNESAANRQALVDIANESRTFAKKVEESSKLYNGSISEAEIKEKLINEMLDDPEGRLEANIGKKEAEKYAQEVSANRSKYKEEYDRTRNRQDAIRYNEIKERYNLQKPTMKDVMKIQRDEQRESALKAAAEQLGYNNSENPSSGNARITEVVAINPQVIRNQARYGVS